MATTSESASMPSTPEDATDSDETLDPSEARTPVVFLLEQSDRPDGRRGSEDPACLKPTFPKGRRVSMPAACQARLLPRPHNEVGDIDNLRLCLEMLTGSRGQVKGVKERPQAMENSLHEMEEGASESTELPTNGKRSRESRFRILKWRSLNGETPQRSSSIPTRQTNTTTHQTNKNSSNEISNSSVDADKPRKPSKEGRKSASPNLLKTIESETATETTEKPKPRQSSLQVQSAKLKRSMTEVPRSENLDDAHQQVKRNVHALVQSFTPVDPINALQQNSTNVLSQSTSGNAQIVPQQCIDASAQSERNNAPSAPLQFINAQHQNGVEVQQQVINFLAQSTIDNPLNVQLQSTNLQSQSNRDNPLDFQQRSIDVPVYSTHYKSQNVQQQNSINNSLSQSTNNDSSLVLQQNNGAIALSTQNNVPSSIVLQQSRQAEQQQHQHPVQHIDQTTQQQIQLAKKIQLALDKSQQDQLARLVHQQIEQSSRQHFADSKPQQEQLQQLRQQTKPPTQQKNGVPLHRDQREQLYSQLQASLYKQQQLQNPTDKMKNIIPPVEQQLQTVYNFSSDNYIPADRLINGVRSSYYNSSNSGSSSNNSLPVEFNRLLNNPLPDCLDLTQPLVTHTLVTQPLVTQPLRRYSTVENRRVAAAASLEVGPESAPPKCQRSNAADSTVSDFAEGISKLVVPDGDRYAEYETIPPIITSLKNVIESEEKRLEFERIISRQKEELRQLKERHERESNEIELTSQFLSTLKKLKTNQIKKIITSLPGFAKNLADKNPRTVDDDKSSTPHQIFNPLAVNKAPSDNNNMAADLPEPMRVYQNSSAFSKTNIDQINLAQRSSFVQAVEPTVRSLAKPFDDLSSQHSNLLPASNSDNVSTYCDTITETTPSDRFPYTSQTDVASYETPVCSLYDRSSCGHSLPIRLDNCPDGSPYGNYGDIKANNFNLYFNSRHPVHPSIPRYACAPHPPPFFFDNINVGHGGSLDGRFITDMPVTLNRFIPGAPMTLNRATARPHCHGYPENYPRDWRTRTYNSHLSLDGLNSRSTSRSAQQFVPDFFPPFSGERTATSEMRGEAGRLAERANIISLQQQIDQLQMKLRNLVECGQGRI